MIPTAVAALLHVLVFVYWLGGDLGAFYASHLAVDRARPPAARLLAMKVIGDVDMAPRSALILTLPTGLTLAAARGWLSLSPLALAAVWAVALGWLALAWRLHLAQAPPGAPLRTLDLAIRWAMIAGLSAAGVAALAHLWPAPLFLALKLCLLAAAIAIGLVIRRRLRPLGPALGAFAGGGDTRAAEDTIAHVLAHSRPLVVAIWVLISTAAFLGLAQPQ